MHYATLDDFVNDLPAHAEKAQDKLKGQNGLFSLTTKQGRTYWAELNDGLVTIPAETPARTADCAVTADEKDMLAMINGELSPLPAILFGRVQIRGDKALLMKLVSLMNG